MTSSLLTTKRRAQGAPRSLPISCPVLSGWRRLWRGRRLRLALEVPACLLGPLLQFVLQLLLLFLELLGIGGRAVIGLGEIPKRNHEADGLAGTIDPLNDQALPFLQLADQFAARFIVRHAAIIEADDVRPSHGLAVVDDHPGAGPGLHT